MNPALLALSLFGPMTTGQMAMPEPTAVYTRADINVDFSYGWLSKDFNDRNHGLFIRARGGILHAREPKFFFVGLTGEFSNFAPPALGIQGEALHMGWGLWAQLGAAIDTDAQPSFNVGAGYSLLGVEGQVRRSDEQGFYFAVFGKIRLPFGMIALVFK